LKNLPAARKAQEGTSIKGYRRPEVALRRIRDARTGSNIAGQSAELLAQAPHFDADLPVS